MGTCKVVLLIFGLLSLCSCATWNRDPFYDGYLNGPDPRTLPYLTRKPGEIPPTKEQIVAAFKQLHRPIIIRYIDYQPKSVFPLIMGWDHIDSRILLTDEACAFIRAYTFDELVLAIGPLMHDPYWSGDAVAVVGVASNPWTPALYLQSAEYRSPDQPGSWPWARLVKLKLWSVGREGSRYSIEKGQVWDDSRDAPATQP